MTSLPRGAVVVVAVASLLALSGCTVPSLVVGGSTVRVASAQPVTSLNDQTAYGNTTANRSIVAATNAGFNYYDDTSLLVRDESFGHYEIVSHEPFAVKYTIAEGVMCSDGSRSTGPICCSPAQRILNTSTLLSSS